MNYDSVPLRDFKELNDWETVMFVYQSALKQINTKIDILNGYDSSIENMVRYVNDIAGIRISCSFTSDIYLIADMISKQNDLTILARRDYMKNPKKSGYRSYHMLVTTPVFLSDSIIDTKVEIQIRTVAQDFWATLEHKMHYKFEGDGPDYITKELRECARYVAELDQRMEELNNEIQKYGKINKTPEV